MTLISGSSLTGEVGISVFETSDGKRFLEYRWADNSGKEKFCLKTTSLFFLQKFITGGKHRDSIKIFPKTKYVFADEATRVSYIYSGDGKPIKNSWLAQEPSGTASGTFYTPVISWQVQKWSHFTLKLTVEYTPASGTPYTVNYQTEKDLTAMGLGSRNWYLRFYELADSETGSAKLDGGRTIDDLDSYEHKTLIEGENFPFPYGSLGRVTVIRSRWKIVSGTAEAKVEDITALTTNLLFSKFGSVELIHDMAVTYDWVVNTHSRQLSSGTIEFAETTLEGEYWLDGWFPCEPPKILLPNEEKPLIGLFKDTPKVGLDEKPPKVVDKVNASAKYRAILFAKPKLDNGDEMVNSIFCPIEVFSWGWVGEGKRNSDDSWAPIAETLKSFYPQPSSPREIPVWSHVANKETIIWREKQ